MPRAIIAHRFTTLPPGPSRPSLTRWPAVCGPPDVKGAVDDVMASVGAQLNTARQCAKAKTIADVNAAWDYVDPHPGSAQVLRARLGLPLAG